jgi:hypothetical protein
VKVVISVTAKHELTEEDLERLVNPHKKEHPAQQIAKASLEIAKAEGIPPATTEIAVKVVDEGQIMASRYWHPEDESE